MKSLYRHKQSGDIFAINPVADCWPLKADSSSVTQFNQKQLFESPTRID